jgi:hypothetical protein
VSLDPPHLTATVTTLGVSSGGSNECQQIAAVNVGPNDGAGHLKSPSNPPVIWTISPPATCIGTPPCGFLELSVYSCLSADEATCSPDPDQIIDSAGPSITVNVAQVSADASLPANRFYRFKVELFNPDATQAVDRNGKTYPADLVYEVNAPCAPPAPPPPDGGRPGRDAAPDVSTPPTDGGKPPPPDATPPPPDATTPVDASSPPRDSALPSDGSAVIAPDAATPTDAGPLPPDARTP